MTTPWKQQADRKACTPPSSFWRNGTETRLAYDRYRSHTFARARNREDHHAFSRLEDNVRLGTHRHCLRRLRLDASQSARKQSTGHDAGRARSRCQEGAGRGRQTSRAAGQCSAYETGRRKRGSARARRSGCAAPRFQQTALWSRSRGARCGCEVGHKNGTREDRCSSWAPLRRPHE